MNAIEKIDRMAYHTLSNFMYSLGITPSEDGLAFADFGPHRVYTLQGEAERTSSEINPDCVFRRLEKYLRNCNNFYKAPHFDAFEIVQGYSRQGQTILYVSLSHTA